MKQSLNVFIALAFAASTLHAETFLKPPDPPVYETCGNITVAGENGSYQVRDTACLSRNSEKQRNYNAMVEAYNRSRAMISDDASKTVKPVEPTYEKCDVNASSNGQYYNDYACLSRNQKLKHDYDIQIDAWNRMQSMQALQDQKALSDQQKAAVAEVQAGSAAESLAKAAAQNAKSSKQSNTAAIVTGALSVAAGVKFAFTCATLAGCQPGYLAASIAFGMMSAQSSKQAHENDMSAFAACTAQSQISTTSSQTCVNPVSYDPVKYDPVTGLPITTPGDQISKLVPETFDQNGNCVATDKNICSQIIAGLPPGQNIQDTLKGMNAFAGAPPYKFNPDGSATTKDGKIYKPEDLKNLEAMKAAGLTDAQAQLALAAMSKASGVAPTSALETAAADLKNAENKATDFGGFAISGSGAADQAKSNDDKSGDVSTSGIGGSGKGKGLKRNPAGEGLTRDFNGDTIGAAGDDIFSMMNRRYKMKTAQDSFMSK